MSLSKLGFRLGAVRGDRIIMLLFQGSAVSMSVRVGGLVLGFVSHLILSRTMGVSQYGSYVIALGWAMVLVIPARLGLDNNVLRFATIYRDEGRLDALRGLILFSLSAIALSSLVIACALLVGRAAGLGPLRAIDARLVAGVACMIFPLAALGLLSALMCTANRILASQFYEQMLRPALLIAGVGFLLLSGRALDASQAMLLTSATVAIALLGIGAHARAVFGSLRSTKPSFSERRSWLSVSWVLFLIGIIQELLNQIDIILIGILGDATQAAHFAAAWRLASLVQFGLTAIVMVSGPLIASAYGRGDTAELARIARHSARFAFLLATVLALILVVAGRPALMLFGPSFADAYPALLIMLSAGLLSAFTGSVAYCLALTGHQRSALFILVGALLLSTILNLLLIPKLGATGGAIASASAVAAWNVAMAIQVRRRIGVDATALGLEPRSVAFGIDPAKT